MKIWQILNIVGLIIDLIGFIGIYFVKLKPTPKINSSQEVRKNLKLQSGINTNNPEWREKIIYDTINKSIQSLNTSIKNQDRKTLKFFIIIIIGIFIQIISQFFLS